MRSHGSLLRCGVAGGARSEAGLVQRGRRDARMLRRERVALCLRDPRVSSCRGRLRGRGKEGEGRREWCVMLLKGGVRGGGGGDGDDGGAVMLLCLSAHTPESRHRSDPTSGSPHHEGGGGEGRRSGSGGE